MKLLFISHDSELTGASKSMLGLIIGLLKEGIEVLVILPELGQLSKQLESSHINFLVSGHRVNTSSLESSSWPKLKQLRLLKFKIQRFVKNIFLAYKFSKKLKKEFYPDYIITNTSTTNFGALLSLFLKTKHIWYLREFGSLDHGFKQDFNSIFKILLQKSKYVVCISKDLERHYKKHYNIKNTYINYNGIYNKNTLLNLHKSLIKPTNCINFIFVGQLTKRKGIWKVINAFLKMNETDTVKLLIVGNGNEFESIELYIKEQRLEDKIELLGYQAYPEKYYKQAHCFIMASDREAFGRTTVEAVAYNCFVIANNQGATKEILEDKKEALYFDGTVADLTLQMNHFLSLRKEQVQSVKDSAFRKVLNEFSQEVNVLKFKSILRSH
ncbi:glycosyltransferase [Winogradskyella undariae]|uniref:glycosyltransferase n=1 Tax=Winogradskyella undariae TaxID=1285465 RepID=UPI00156AC443|nr:glycosyltransferase [Winogradskyella undariae]NRR91027.1 glycosyltransferase [Winogradskyella undariae]